MAKQLNMNLSFTADTTQAKKQIQDLQQQLTNLTSNLGKKQTSFGLTKEINEAANAVASLQASLTQAINTDTGHLDLGKFSQSLQQSHTSLKQYQTTLNSLGPTGSQAFAQLSNALMMAEVPLRQTNALMSQLWTTLKNTAKWQISSSVLHGLMSSISGAYSYAQNLNESLNNIRIVTGETADQMAKFAEQANNAARALSTTTTAYTNAALIFYQQGLTGDDVTERVNVAIKLANVTGETASDISDQMTSIWNNFAKGSENLEHYADVITSLGANTASSSKEIAEGLQKFAAVADTVGLSYEYATTALATVVAQTRQSADVVGTAFKTIFSRMESLKLGNVLDDGTTLGQYSEALYKVGVNIKDANGELKSMDAILDETGEKWQTLGKDQQVALAQAVAGVRQYQQFIALMDNWDFFESNLEIANTSDGSLQKQADIYAESWDAAAKRVKASAEEIYSTLLNDEFFIDLNNALADCLDEIKVLIDALGGVPGILTLITSATTTLFGTQMATGIDNMIYNIQRMTKSGRTAIEETRKEINQLLIDSATNLGSTVSGKALGEAYQELGEAQSAYLNAAEKMDPLQKSIAQNLLDQQQALVRNVELASQSVEKAEQENAIQEKQMLRIAAQNAKQTPISGGYAIDNGSKLVKELSSIAREGAKIEEIFRSIERLKIMPQNAEQFSTWLQKTGITADQLGQVFGGDAKKHLDDFIQALQQGNATKMTESWNELLFSISGGGDKLEEVRNKLIEFIGGTDTTSEAYKKATVQVDNFIASLQNEGVLLGQLGLKKQQLTDRTSAVITAFNQLQQKNITLGTSFVSLTSAVSTFAMGLQTINGLIETWNDEDISGAQKLLTTLTSLGMALPMLTRAFNADTKANILNIGVKLTGAKGEQALTTIRTAATAATQAQTVSTLELAGAYTTLLAPILAIIAVAAVLIAYFVQWNKEYESNAKKAKLASESADALTQKYEEAKDAFEDLKESITTYEDCVDALETLTKGTEKYKEETIKANDAARDLIDNYSELAGKWHYDADNGLITFDTNALDDLENSQSNYLNDQEIASLKGKNASLSANNVLGLENLTRDNDIKFWDQYWDVVGQHVAGMGIAGAAVGSVASPIGSAIGGGAGAIIGAGGAALDSWEAIKQQEEYNKQQQEIANKLIDLYLNNGGDFDQAYNSLTSEDKMYLAGIETGLADLCVQIKGNTDAITENNRQIIDNNLKNEAYYKNTKEKNQLNKVLTQKYEEEEKKLQNKYTNLDDEEIQKRYRTALNYNSVSNNKDDNTATYTDKNGNEITIDNETARAYLIAQEALENLKNSAEEVTNSFNKLYNAGDNLNTKTALSTFVNGETGNFDALTKGEFKQLDINKILSNYTDEDAQNIGYTDKADLTNKLNIGKTDTENKWTALQNNYLENLTNSDALSYSTSKAFSDLFNNIQFGKQGEKGANAVLDGFNSVLSKYKVSFNDTNNVIAALTNVDWTAWDAGNDAAAIMKNLGYEVDTTDDSWIQFMNDMRSANGAIPDFSVLKDELLTIASVLDDISSKGTISSKSFEELIAINSELKDSFMALSNGTYQYLGNLDELKASTKEIYKDQLQLSRNRAKAETLVDNAGWNVDWSDIASDSTTNQYDYRQIGEAVQNNADTMEALNLAGYNSDQINEMTKSEEGVKKIASILSGLRGSAIEAQEVEEIMASMASSYDELNASLQDGTISPETYNKSLISFATSAIQATTSIDELNLALYEVSANNIELPYSIISNQLQQLASDYDNCTAELQDYQIALESGNQEEINTTELILSNSIAIGEEAKKYNIDAEALELQVELLQKYNKEMSPKQALAMASANTRLNSGVKKLYTNWKDWKKVIDTSDVTASDYADTINDLTDVLVELTGIVDASEVPFDFFDKTTESGQEHLDLMAKAAEGNEKAISQLSVAVAKSKIEMLSWNDVLNNLDGEGTNPFNNLKTSFEETQNALLSDVDTLAFAIKNGLESGTSLTDILGSSEAAEQFVTNLNKMAMATGMSVDEMQGYLNALNLKSEIITKPVKKTTQVPQYVTYENVQELGEGASTTNGVKTYKKWTETKITGYTPVTETVEVAQINMGDQSGGPKVTYEAPSVSPSSTTKTSSGGSSNKSNVSRVKKTTDSRYKEVDDSLEDVANQLKKIQRLQDAAYGRSAIKALNKYNTALKEQIALDKKKVQQAEAYLIADKAELEAEITRQGIGQLTFDNDGDISNFESTIGKKYEEYNKMVEEFNKKYQGQDQTDQSKAEKDKLDAMKAEIDELKELVDQYDETKKIIQELEDEEEELQQQIKSNNYQKITVQIEYKVQADENALTMIDTKIKILGDDLYKTAEVMALTVSKLSQQSNMYNTYSASIDKLNSAYRNDQITKADYIAGLQEAYDQIISIIEAYKELDDTMMNYYGEALDKISEKLAKYTDRMEHLNTVLESYKTINSLLGATKSAESKAVTSSILSAQTSNKKNEYSVYAQEYAMYKEEEAQIQAKYDAAKTDAEKEFYEKELEAIKEKTAEAQENMLSSATEVLEAIHAEWENTMENLADELESSMTGAFGTFENLQTQMELTSTRADEYLTKTNQIYETNKMMRTLQSKIDATDNNVAKQKLSNFAKEIEAAQNQNELSNLELEILQAKYKVMEAQIALEEAQNAKSTVRLKRDSEGNYGYVYTADQDKISDAEQALDDANNDLYNIRLEAANSYSEKIVATEKEMKEKLQEIWADETLTAEQKAQKEQEIKEKYYAIIESYQKLYGVATEEDARVVADAWSSAYRDITTDTETWKNSTETYSTAAKKATTDCQSALTEFAKQAKIDHQSLTDGTKSVKDESDALATKVTETEIPAMKNLLTEINKVTDGYAKQRDAILKLIEAMQKRAEEAEKYRDDAANTSDDDDDSSGGPGTSGFQWYQQREGDDTSWWYGSKNADGSSKDWVKSGWQQIDGKWYLFNDEGYMVTPDEDGYVTDTYNGKTYKWKVNTNHDGSYGSWTGDNPLDASTGKEATDYKQGNYTKATTQSGNSPTSGSSSGSSGSGSTSGKDGKALYSDFSTAGFTPDLKANAEIGITAGKRYNTQASSGKMGYYTGGWAQIDGKYYLFSNNGTLMYSSRDKDIGTYGFGLYHSDKTGAWNEKQPSDKDVKKIKEENGENTPLWSAAEVEEYDWDAIEEYYKKYDDEEEFRTGGYTGAWGNDGKMAVLHEKELVLNASDTENLLNAVDLVRELVSVIDLNAAAANSATYSSIGTISSDNGVLEQMVTITAEFPNATNHSEIEEAFDNLINRASQYANSSTFLNK